MRKWLRYLVIAYAALVIFMFLLNIPIPQATAQITANMRFEKTKQFIGVQYLFDDTWSTQFEGRIDEISNNAFEIAWFVYGGDTAIRTNTFSNPRADSYRVEVEVAYSANTSKTVAVFRVLWLKEGRAVSYQKISEELAIRDNELKLRSIAEVVKVRKINYIVGLFQ